jgi:hypothetical protein
MCKQTRYLNAVRNIRSGLAVSSIFYCATVLDEAAAASEQGLE